MRLLRKVLFRAALLVICAIAAGVIWRNLALEAAGKYTLKRLGFDQALVTVDEVSFHHIAVSTVSLGPGLPSLKAAVIRFEPLNLLRGEILSVEADGLRAVVQEDGGNLKKLLQLLSDKRSVKQSDTPRTSDAVPLPGFRLTDGLIVLENTPLGDGSARIEGQASLNGPAPQVSLIASLQTTYAEASLEAKTAIVDGLNAVEVTGHGMLDAARLTEAAPLASETARLVRSGEASFNLSGRYGLPPELTNTDGYAWGAAPFAVSGTIQMTDAATMFAPETVSGAVSFEVHRVGTSVTATLSAPAAFTISNIPPEHLRLTRLNLPDGEPILVTIPSLALSAAIDDNAGTGDWAAETSAEVWLSGMHLALAADANGDAGKRSATLSSIDISATDLVFALPTGDVNIDKLKTNVNGEVQYLNKLTIKGFMQSTVTEISAFAGSLEHLAASGPFNIELDNDLSLTADSQEITAEGLTISPPDSGFRIDGAGPYTASVPKFQVSGGSIDGHAVLSAREILVQPENQKQSAVRWDQVTVVAAPAAAGSTTPALTLSADGLDTKLPGAGIRLSKGSLSASLGDGPLELSATLTDEQRQKRFTATRLRLSGARTGQQVNLRGNASLAGGGVIIPLMIKADTSSGEATADFGPANMVFAPGGLQPTNLTPLLNQIEQLIGQTTISGEALIERGRPPKISAKANIDNLTVLTDGLRTEGLSGTLAFSSLNPLISDGNQRLTLRRLVAGVPITDVEAVFHIPRSRRGMTVVLNEAAATLAGGRIRVGRVVYRGGAADLQVGISNLPLEQLLEDWKVEGLKGTGLIAGSLPVSIRPKGVAIKDGSLLSLRPGVIQVDFGSARQTLRNAGDQVDLAVRTLEDFHYNTLTLGVSKPFGGELELRVGLNGKNPAALDGYPFRFNVNLSGKLEPILEAIQSGERLSTGLLQGSLGN